MNPCYGKFHYKVSHLEMIRMILNGRLMKGKDFAIVNDALITDY